MHNYGNAMLRAALIALALILSAAPVSAGVWEDADAAFSHGDYAEAMRLWRHLAEQGDAAAQGAIGMMYDIGKGVPEDDAEAAKWYRMAAEQGKANAQFVLGLKYVYGEGVPQDYVAAHMWLNLAAAQGWAAAKKDRDIVAKRMTREQIAEAQRLAREWKPK